MSNIIYDYAAINKAMDPKRANEHRKFLMCHRCNGYLSNDLPRYPHPVLVGFDCVSCPTCGDVNVIM